MNIIEKNPRELRPHPAIARMHRWDKTSDEFLAFCRLVREEGILDPLKVTHDSLVVDGEMRRQAAVRLGLETVPCVEVGPAEVPGVVVAAILGRRHYTKGQRAYLVQEQMESAWVEARKRKEANLTENRRKSLETPETASSGIENGRVSADPCLRTVEAWSEAIGVSKDELQRAREIRTVFRSAAWKDRKLRWDAEQIEELGYEEGEELTLEEYFEAWIFHPEKPMGLGSVKRGMGSKIQMVEANDRGYVHAGRHSVDGQRMFQLFCEAWDVIWLRSRDYWPELDEDGRKAALGKIGASITEAPDDLLSELRKLIRAEWTRRNSPSAQ